MQKKLKASSLLQAVFVCLLIGTLCFGMLLMSSYNSLFQKRTLQKTQLQLTNDSAIQLMLANLTKIKDGAIKTNVFSDHIHTDIKVSDWGFYKVLCAKTYHKSDTIQKNILVGEITKPTTALYVSNYDKILNVAGNVTITGNMYIPKGILEKKNMHGERTNVNIQGIQKTSEDRLPRLYNMNTKTIFKSDSVSTIETIGKAQTYVRAFDKDTQVFMTNDLSFLEGKTIKGNIIFQSDGTVTLRRNMKLEDVIVNAKNVVVEEGFIGNVQIIASTSVIIEDKVQLKYPSSILIQEPKEAAKITIGKESMLIGGIILNNSNHKAALKSALLIDEKATVVGTVYCYGAVELKGNVYGSVYADRLNTKTNETSYANLLMNAEINISKLPESFIGIPLFDTNEAHISSYEAVKEL
ncbi:hypothetical protein [Kordia sp.]|uniref:hypothetical protein n=1 Tax=Kordia sp. TaxID=1965332 RepID=UPI003D6AA973